MTSPDQFSKFQIFNRKKSVVQTSPLETDHPNSAMTNQNRVLFPLPLTSPTGFSLCLSSSMKWHHLPSTWLLIPSPPSSLFHYHSAQPLKQAGNPFTFFFCGYSTAVTLVHATVCYCLHACNRFQRSFPVSILVLIVVLSLHTAPRIISKHVNQITSFFFLTTFTLSPQRTLFACLVLYFHCGLGLPKSLSLFMLSDSFLIGKLRTTTKNY